jgi:hypothetical protein
MEARPHVPAHARPLSARRLFVPPAGPRRRRWEGPSRKCGLFLACHCLSARTSLGLSLQMPHLAIVHDN